MACFAGNCAVSEDCKHGFRVRLVNLPKKKNIHRDLQSAFKGVPGIVDIVPVVSGNKRTKDPICKGLAFIDFKSENEAFRYNFKYVYCQKDEKHKFSAKPEYALRACLVSHKHFHGLVKIT